MNKSLQTLLISAGVLCGLARLPAAEIHLLHYNDFHAGNIPRHEADGYGNFQQLGGAAWLKGMVDSLTTLHPASLLLHAGDDFQGSPICGLTSGGSQVAIMNAMELDLLCPGNHEFDYGDRNLLQQLEKATFNIACCNLADSSGRLIWPPCHVFEVGGLRLGFIGVMTAGLTELVVKSGLTNTVVLDPVTEIRRQMEQLETESDLQFLVSHSGLRADSIYAASVSGLEGIIGGHSHTLLPDGMRVGETLIVQAGCCGRRLGDLTINIDDATGTVTGFTALLHDVSPQLVTPDAKMQAVVEELYQQLPGELNEVIGRLTTPWIRAAGESNLGDWTADVMRDYANTDLAFMNLGGLRRDLPAGEITRLDIWEVHPFGNHYVKFEMSGLELFRFLRQVAAGSLSESFAYSGMEFTIHREPGSVSRILIDGESLVMNRRYSAVTNNFIFSHLEELFGLDPLQVSEEQLPELDRDVICRAVLEQQTIEAVNHHRITFH